MTPAAHAAPIPRPNSTSNSPFNFTTKKTQTQKSMSMGVHRNNNLKKFIYFPDVELDVELVRSLATDVKCFFIHYLVVKVYNYVELEIKLKLLDFFLFDRILL